MKYEFIERKAEYRGHNWFGHRISLYVIRARMDDLLEHLKTYGPRGKCWRLEDDRVNFLFGKSVNQLVRFSSKSDAMRFKLSWEEDAPEDPLAWLRKLNLNSTFGSMAGGTRRGAVTSVAPTWKVPIISPAAAGILPLSQPSYKIMKSRSCNPCDEIIILDYESNIGPWMNRWLEGREIHSWYDYTRVLDAGIQNEEQK